MTLQDDFDALSAELHAMKKKMDTWEQNLLGAADVVPGTMRLGPSLTISPNGLVSQRRRGQYGMEMILGNYGASVPAGNEDMDIIADGVINILDLSYISAHYLFVPKDSSIIWLNEKNLATPPTPIYRQWTDGATPSNAFYFGGSQKPMSSIAGIASSVPNGQMTEHTQIDLASSTSWGRAGVHTHGTKTGATDADASVAIRTEKSDTTIAATLLVYSEDDGVCYVAVQDAPFWFPVLAADPSNLQDGMAWYRSDTDVIRARINGATVTIAPISASILTDTAWAAKGDLVAGTANDTAAILSIGANGTVLTADSAETTGMKWATPAGGSFSYGKAITTSQGQNLP